MALQTPDKLKTSEDEFDMDPASIASDKDLHKKVARVREELEAELLKRLKMQVSLINQFLKDRGIKKLKSWLKSKNI